MNNLCEFRKLKIENPEIRKIPMEIPNRQNAKCLKYQNITKYIFPTFDFAKTISKYAVETMHVLETTDLKKKKKTRPQQTMRSIQHSSTAVDVLTYCDQRYLTKDTYIDTTAVR